MVLLPGKLAPPAKPSVSQRGEPEAIKVGPADEEYGKQGDVPPQEPSGKALGYSCG